MHTTEQEDIIWIQFNDPQVGTSHRRKKMHRFYTNSVLHSWTPIRKIARRVKTFTKIVTRK